MSERFLWVNPFLIVDGLLITLFGRAMAAGIIMLLANAIFKINGRR